MQIPDANSPIKDDDSPAMKVTKVLFKEFPHMEKGDPVEVTQAACTLADILGCVVALLHPQLSPGDFEKIKDGLIERMDVSTKDIVKSGTAMREARKATMQ